MANLANAYYKNTFLSQNQSLSAAKRANNIISSKKHSRENIITFKPSHITPFVENKEDNEASNDIDVSMYTLLDIEVTNDNGVIIIK